MFLLNTITNSDILLYGCATISLCVLSAIFLKTYFTATSSQSSSPQTFNLTHDQVKEINEALDRGEQLDEEIQHKLDQDFKQMLGDDNYAEFKEEIDQINSDFLAEIEDIFNNFDMFT